MSRHRSLAAQLRSWPDDRLVALLDARPDLAVPAPADAAQLASRISTPASVHRVLDRCTTVQLAVLEAAVVAGPGASREDVLSLVHAGTDRAGAALDRLLDLVLVWEAAEGLRVVAAVPDALGMPLSGLAAPVARLLSDAGPARVAELLAALGGRPSGDRARDVDLLASRLRDPAVVETALVEVGPAARDLVRHLDGSGPATGDLRDAEGLAARGLLILQPPGRWLVPREVSLALRGGRTTRDPVPEPPPLPTTTRAPKLVAQAAAGAALELLQQVELLLEAWSAAPPAELRAGGLAVRDLRTAARLLHLEEPAAALVVELALVAGLLGRGTTKAYDHHWAPTEAYDGWLRQPPAARWSGLARAWLGSTRLTGLVGTRVDGKTVNALAPDPVAGWLPGVRHLVLAELAEAGGALAPGGEADLVARVGWLRPRLRGGRDQAVRWTLREAAQLGVTGLGALTAPGQALLSGEDPAAALGPLLPAPVDHVLLQADLTAVAPGPLEQRLARDLALVAEVESRGGATVYRFTERSVRHALDRGWTATDVHEVLDRAARTEVPQPLRYLVDDVARTHGSLRLGSARTFLRSDDEAAVAALFHDPRSRPLNLRRIAPTVLVTNTSAETLLGALQEMGLAPVIEGPGGEVKVAAAPRHRADRRHRPPYASPDHRAVVAHLRAGEDVAAARARVGTEGRQSPAAVVAALHEAVEGTGPVWLDYVGDDGVVQDHVVSPQRVDGGRLRAVDHRSGTPRWFVLHRVTAVRALA